MVLFYAFRIFKKANKYRDIRKTKNEIASHFQKSKNILYKAFTIRPIGRFANPVESFLRKRHKWLLYGEIALKIVDRRSV